MSNVAFPWNLITQEMLDEWSAKTYHMSDFHMMGEAYLMIEGAKQAAEAATTTRPEPRRPFLELD